MDPEKSKDGYKKADHQDIGPVKDWIGRSVFVVRMGNKFHKTQVKACVADLAVPDKILRMNGRTGVFFRQDIVAVMAVGTPRNTMGIADTADFPVIRLAIIGGRRQ